MDRWMDGSIPGWVSFTAASVKSLPLRFHFLHFEAPPVGRALKLATARQRQVGVRLEDAAAVAAAANVQAYA